MADLLQFTGMQEIGTPAPVVQQVAADTSEATRIGGQQRLFEGVVGAGVAAYQGREAVLNNKATQEIIGGGAPDDLAGSFANIASSRQYGVSGERARTNARNLLKQSIASNPSRAAAYKQAYTSYFGETGGGAGAFDKTDTERLIEQRVEFGFKNFGIDPTLAQTDPARWEQVFTQNLTLMNQNSEAEAVLKQMETGVKFDKMQQQSYFPSVITNALTNKDSADHLPTLVKGVLASSGITSEAFSAATGVQAVQNLNNLELQLQAHYKSQFSALGVDEFNAVFAPVKAYIDNVRKVANGELGFEALQRENKIFQEAAIMAVQNGNPQASAALVGLNSLVAGLPTIPPAIVMEQARLTKLIVNAMPQILNHDSPVTGIDLVGKEGVGAYNRQMQQWLAGASNIYNNGTADSIQKHRASQVVVGVTKDILAQPDSISAKTYQEWFKVLTTPNAFDGLSNSAKEGVLTTLANGGVDRYLADTIKEWNSQAEGTGTHITFDTDLLKLVATPNDRTNQAQRIAAAKINAKMGESNVVFEAFNAVGLGRDMVGALSPVMSAMGMGVEEGIAPITTQELDAARTTFRDIPKWGQSNGRLSVLSGVINDGRATPSQIAEFERTVAKYPRLKDMAVPELQEAIRAITEEPAPAPTPEPQAARPATRFEGDRPVMLEHNELDGGYKKQLVAQLHRHEGTKKNDAGEHEVYVDSRGFNTVGYGHKVLEEDGLALGDTITEEEAKALFEKDMAWAEPAAKKVVGAEVFDSLNAARRAVLVNMAFNLGEEGLSKFVKTLAAVRAGDWEEAKEEMLDSLWATQVGSRATQLAEQMLTGVWQ
jgi:lysozyme